MEPQPFRASAPPGTGRSSWAVRPLLEVALVVVLMVAVVLGTTAKPGSAGAGDSASSSTPTVASARAKIASGEQAVVDADVAIAAAEGDIVDANAAIAAAQRESQRLRNQRDVARGELNRLTTEEAETVEQLQLAQRRARQATVRVYTGGGGVREFDYLMDAVGNGDLLWRQELLVDHAVDADEAIEVFEEMRSLVSDEAAAFAGRLDRLSSRIEEQQSIIPRSRGRIASAEAEISSARRDMETARERIRRGRIELSAAQAAAQYAAAGRTQPGAGGWAALRNCESGGNYGTNTGNGFYGAYQFDLQTWQSMGGTGLPSDAPPWEQDMRAAALYQARGSQPWPVCGRFLP